MATELEKKKAKAELLRVQANVAEMDARIEDHKENIARLEASMAVSAARVDELLVTIQGMGQ